MKVVVLHTDFRIYWPARLSALHAFLQHRGISLCVIEIAGKGSNYSFCGAQATPPSYWTILFPEHSPEELPGSVIKEKLFATLCEMSPAVVIAGAIAFPSGALAVAWGQKHKRRVIIFDDAKMEAVRRNPLTNYIKKAVYQGVDAMIFPAPDWTPTGRFWGFAAEQLFFGIDVIDNDFWAKPREDGAPKANYLVAVGRQIPKKNFLSLLKAYQLYINSVEGAPYRLLLVGDGPEHQALVEFISENSLTHTVTCMPFQSQERLAAIYQHAQALICCSNVQETWGLVINEAMACGCPVLASNESGATNTLVHQGVNGYRFPCGDVKALAETMARLYRLSPDEHLQMRNASREIIRQWGLPRFCQAVADAIDYVVLRPKRMAPTLGRCIINRWNGRYRPL